MSAAGTAAPGHSPATIPAAGLRRIGHGLVWLTLVSGFYVTSEPAPYDLLAIAVAGLFFLSGLPIARGLGLLVLLTLGFLAGGVLGLTQALNAQAATFIAVTGYLALSAIFFACFVAALPGPRLALAMNAMLAAGLLAALVAIGAYFAGAGGLMLYGRAAGTFKDPNVLGAFLVLPAAYAMMLALERPLHRALAPVAAYGVLALAALLTFSRGAWGALLLATILVGLFAFLTAPTARAKTRLLVIGSAAILAALLAVLAILSLDSVAALFAERASFAQSYDSGYEGRFHRHILGFALALERPLGIGALQFARYFPEDPHNVYLNAFVSYGWLGGLCYLALVLATLWRALRLALCARSARTWAIPLAAAFTATALEGLVIDTDHWRHFFVMVGLIWGLDVAWRRQARGGPSQR